MPLISIFVVINIISGLIAIILGIYTFRFRHTEYQITLSFLFFFVAWWDFGTAFESMQYTLEDHITGVALTYPGMMFSPVFLYLFLYQYTHINFSVRRMPFYLLGVIPVITCVFVLHPEWRSLVWKFVELNPIPYGNIAHFEHGWWFYVAAFYSYGLLILGIYHLIRSLSQFPKRYTWQVRFLLLSALFPLVANLIYTFNSEYLLGLDITPIALTIMTALFYFAISRHKLLQLRPIARNTVMENINEGVIVIDNENVIIDYNQAADEIIKQYMPGHPNEISIDGIFNEQPEFAAFIRDPLMEKQEINLQGHYYEISKQSVLHQSGKLSDKVIVFHDITDIKKKEEEIITINQQLKKANEIKDFLFRVISHDLKGPVGNITSLILYLIENEKEGMTYKRELEVLHKASANAYHLLENILQWANAQRNEMHLQPEVCRLSNTISQACEVIRYQAKEKNISIHIRCDNRITVFCDATTIEIVMRNLLSNAIKFSHKNGNIDIIAEITGEHALVKITDSGIGISDSTLQTLSKGFILPSQPGTMKEKGTGIGLYICQNLVKVNHGTMNIESHPGQGTIVTLLLPVK